MLCKTGGLGGMERLVARLASQLPSLGLNIRLILPARSTPVIGPDLVSWFSRRGVVPEVSSAFKISSVPDLRNMLRLAKLFRESPAEVVNLHFGESSIFLMEVLAARLAGKRCIVSPHNTTPLHNSWHAMRVRAAATLCETIVVGSVALRQLLLNTGVPQRKIRMIRIGIPSAKRALSRAEAREHLAIGPDEFVVICVARLIRDKGIDVLIAAVERVAASSPKVSLLVVGDGEERSALEAHARLRLKDRARFLGFVEDPDGVYPAADLLALPTRMDGAPMVPKEAARFAVPSVASDVGGVRDSIIDGETGLLVPAEDVAALARAIQRVVEDNQLRRRLGENARRFAELEFSESGMLKAYADVLRKD